MAVKRQYVINQFEPPALPPAWNRDPDARRFYTRLMEVLERLYNRSLGEAQIKRGSITADKLAPGIIDEYVLGPDAVDTVNIKNKAVTSAKIDDSAVATVNLRPGAVTVEKIAPTVPIQMDLSQNTSLLAITDPMDAALNDQATGLVGRMGTVEQTLNDDATGLVGDLLEDVGDPLGRLLCPGVLLEDESDHQDCRCVCLGIDSGVLDPDDVEVHGFPDVLLGDTGGTVEVSLVVSCYDTGGSGVVDNTIGQK